MEKNRGTNNEEIANGCFFAGNVAGLAALPAAAQQQYQGYGMGPAAGYGESGMMGHGAYGHGMMYTDDYEEHGPGMMGSGWMNWRKWWPWRDNN